MQRYFLEGTYAQQETYELEGNDFHHAAHVMRMTTGQACYLSFSNQETIIAEVTEIVEDKVLLKEVGKEEMTKEMPYDVTIACGYTKGDKLEWVAQKATELGMAGLIGFPAKASVVKWDHKKLDKKQPRLEKIVKEAAEQSHRQLVPRVSLLTAFSELIEEIDGYDIVLVAYEESAKVGEQTQLVQTLQSITCNQRVLVVFGPEGGVMPEEILALEAKGAKLCALGPRILRAETAPLYLLSAMSYQWELLL